MTSSKAFENALTFATRLHANDMRKGSDTPYISHLLAVTAIALDYGATECEAIAALLHDAIEDQGGQKTLEEIRHRFGDQVASLASACSDRDETPKPPWRERKEAFVARLRTEPYSVRLVVAADKLHNVRDVLRAYRVHGDALWSHFKGRQEGTVWYYHAVIGTLRNAERPEELQLNAIIAEIDHTLSRLEQAIAEKSVDVSPTEPV